MQKKSSALASIFKKGLLYKLRRPSYYLLLEAYSKTPSTIP